MNVEDVLEIIAEVETHNDELTQQAARELLVAAQTSNLAEHNRTRAVFLAVSYCFTPEPLGEDRIRIWRNYASRQYLIATGKELKLSRDPLNRWRNLGRLVAVSFADIKIDESEKEDNKSATLAVAILRRNDP
jgi:hypothetical protein